MDALPDSEITTALAALHGGWVRSDDGTAITRDLEFADFSTAFGFMTAVALDAQAANHHPHWSNGYAQVRISLSTHDAGGLTGRDFALAARVDAHAAGFGAA